MLEQVGKAGAALRLDAEADVVHHLDQHDRRRAVLADDDLQAVGEREVFDRNVERLRWDGRCDEQQQRGKQRQ